MAAARERGIRAHDVGWTRSVRLGRARIRAPRFFTAFPNYLFLEPAGKALAFLSARNAATQIILDFRYCTEGDLQKCQDIINAAANTSAERGARVGDNVRINAGPLEGYCGEYKSLDSDGYANIAIFCSSLGIVKIPFCFLEKSYMRDRLGEVATTPPVGIRAKTPRTPRKRSHAEKQRNGHQS